MLQDDKLNIFEVPEVSALLDLSTYLQVCCCCGCQVITKMGTQNEQLMHEFSNFFLKKKDSPSRSNPHTRVYHRLEHWQQLWLNVQLFKVWQTFSVLVNCTVL